MPIGIPCSALNGASSEPGSVLVCQAGTSLIQPQSNSTVPPRLGSLTSSTPCASSQLASSTIATQWAPVRLATGDRVGHVIGVAVADRDVGRVDVVGGGHRGRVVRLQERVDQDVRLALAQLEAGVAVELDLHLQRSPSSGRSVLASALPVSAQPTATPTIIPIRASSASRARTAAIRSSGSGTVAALSVSRLVRLAEPAALGEGRGQHLLQLRRRPGDDPLGLGEALGLESRSIAASELARRRALGAA